MRLNFCIYIFACIQFQLLSNDFGFLFFFSICLVVLVSVTLNYASWICIFFSQTTAIDCDIVLGNAFVVLQRKVAAEMRSKRCSAYQQTLWFCWQYSLISVAVNKRMESKCVDEKSYGFPFIALALAYDVRLNK